MRVLVVEDQKELATTIAVGLRREGMAVDVAFDGEAALEHAARSSYDVDPARSRPAEDSTATTSAEHSSRRARAAGC